MSAPVYKVEINGNEHAAYWDRGRAEQTADNLAASYRQTPNVTVRVVAVWLDTQPTYRIVATMLDTRGMVLA